MTKHLAIAAMAALFPLAAPLAAAPTTAGEWQIWEGFDAQPGEDFHPWKAEDWPMSRAARLQVTDTFAAEGRHSAQADITVIGWAGAVRALKMKHLPATPAPLRAAVYCQAGKGATGAPVAKLEVYRADNGEAIGGLDTPLQPGQWTSVAIPAGTVNASWDGIGVVLFPGVAKGNFRIFVDDIRVGETLWEGFESGLAQRAWNVEAAAGPNQFLVSDRMPATLAAGSDGKCAILSWTQDSDGVELKHHASQPLDFSECNQLKLRAATLGSATTVGLWLWDGAKGVVVPADRPLATGGWGDLVYDVAAHGLDVNLARLFDVGLVFGGGPGDQGVVYLDSLSRRDNPPAATPTEAGIAGAAACPSWSRYEPTAAASAVGARGTALVYVRSSTTDFCRVFERGYLLTPSAAPTLAKHSLFFIDAASSQGMEAARALGVQRVPALVLMRGKAEPARLQVAQNTSQQDILSFLDGL